MDLLSTCGECFTYTAGDTLILSQQASLLFVLYNVIKAIANSTALAHPVLGEEKL
jgi:hypothetical protein